MLLNEIVRWIFSLEHRLYVLLIDQNWTCFSNRKSIKKKSGEILENFQLKILIKLWKNISTNEQSWIESAEVKIDTIPNGFQWKKYEKQIKKLIKQWSIK